MTSQLGTAASETGFGIVTGVPCLLIAEKIWLIRGREPPSAWRQTTAFWDNIWRNIFLFFLFFIRYSFDPLFNVS